MAEQFKIIGYPFLYDILQLVVDKCKYKNKAFFNEKDSFTVPCICDIYPLIYSIFTLCIVPLFYFNFYILTLVQANNIGDYSILCKTIVAVL